MKTTRIILVLCSAACMTACDVNSVRTGQDSHDSTSRPHPGDALTGQSTPQQPILGGAETPRTPTAGERGSGSSAR